MGWQDAPAVTAQPAWASAPAVDGNPKTSQTLGFEQSVGKVLSNAAGFGDWMGRKVGLPMDAIERGISGGHSLDESRQMLENPAHAPNEVPGNIGKFAGALPLAVGLGPAGPLLGGAAFGALTSNKTDAVGVGMDAAVGGLLGKGTDLGLQAAQKVISPVLSPAVQKLMAAKIPLTPGQTLGGAAKAMEDKITSWPIVGDMVKNAQTNSVKGFNKAVLNETLAPIGKALPPGKEAGREAVDHVAQTISDHYDAILPKMTGVLDPQLQTEINNIGQSAIGLGVKQETLDRFKNILKAQVLDRADPSGVLTGDALKAAQQNLGKVQRTMGASQNADDQHLADLVSDAQSAFNDMLSRNNPKFAPDLANANAAYARYVRVRRAAGAVGSKDGMFSAPQFANAVKAMDNSAGKGSYARGKAFMQDLSDPANQVLPSSVPDSGTTGRALAAAMLGSGGLMLPKVALPAAGVAALYTQPGQAFARGLFGGTRPAWAPGASAALGRARLPLSLLAASQAPALTSSGN